MVSFNVTGLVELTRFAVNSLRITKCGLETTVKPRTRESTTSGFLVYAVLPHSLVCNCLFTRGVSFCQFDIKRLVNIRKRVNNANFPVRNVSFKGGLVRCGKQLFRTSLV